MFGCDCGFVEENIRLLWDMMERGYLIKWVRGGEDYN